MGSKTRIWVFRLISSPAPEPWVYASRQVATLPFLSENENGPEVSGLQRKLIQRPCAEAYGNIVYQSLRRRTFGTHTVSPSVPAGNRTWVLPGCSRWVQGSHTPDGTVMLGLLAQYSPGHATVGGFLSISPASWLVLFC